MFGRDRGIRPKDEPTWREKLADWRAAPPWVIEMPSWLSRFTIAGALVFVGTVFALMTIVYAAIPPGSLPQSLPGNYTPVTIKTTTTTVPPAATGSQLKAISHMTADELKALKNWADAQAQFAAQLTISRQQLAQKAPARRLRYALLCGVVTIALFASAWSRSRRRVAGLDGR